MKDEIIKKEEVEEMLGCGITDVQFEEALKHARYKQEYLRQRERGEVVKQHWYLVKLTEEYVISLALSKFTMDLCQKHRDMEKEHLTHPCKGTPPTSHIVAHPAL